MTVNAQTMLELLAERLDCKYAAGEISSNQVAKEALTALRRAALPQEVPAQPQCAREPVNQTSRDWSICNAVDAYRAPRNEGDTRTLSDFLEEQGLTIAAHARPESNTP